MGASDQHELALTRRPQAAGVSVEFVRTRKNAGAAFTLACDASGLDDKEIHLSLDMDAGTFSRIKSGKNTLNADLVSDFCRVVGNTIYVEWLAYQVGFGLVMLKTEAERRAEEEAARADEAERKLAWALETIKSIRA